MPAISLAGCAGLRRQPRHQVVGDRFVFQSEVLFPSRRGHAVAGGRGDLDKFAMVYQQWPPPAAGFAGDHRSAGPHRPGADSRSFSSNWELSTARGKW